MVKFLWLSVGFIALQRLIELRISARHTRFLFEQGGKEFGKGHYPLFFLLHTAWLISWISEVYWKGISLNTFWVPEILFLIFAQGLRVWSIKSLGNLWTTRVIVIPHQKRICSGPYRFFSHPAYLAASIELACFPLLFNAWRTALVTSLLNFLLLVFVRIPTEKKAMAAV